MEESDSQRVETNDSPLPVVEHARARVGAVLRGKWRLDRLFGVGGMAAVYSATHRTGSRVDIKMLHAVHAWDVEIRRRFLREGYVANTVAHPGAVRILDDDVAEDGAVFLVMDLLEGETLEARSQRLGGRLPAEDLLPLVHQLLDILVAAHTKRIVHRDLKPENIFLTHEGVVKLLDFGVARLRSPNSTSVTTLHGAMFGTPAFMPPEQALGRTEQVDAQSDLWAVGALMFSLLAGRLIHVTETLTELLVAHASKPAPSLSAVAPHVPDPIVAIVDRALEFEKARRWPDAQAMQQAVQEAQAALGCQVSGSPSGLGRRMLATPTPPEASAGLPSMALGGGALSVSELRAARRVGVRHPMLFAISGVSVALAIAAGVLVLRRGHDTATAELPVHAAAADSTAPPPVQAATAPSASVAAEPAPDIPGSRDAPPVGETASGLPSASVPTPKAKAPTPRPPAGSAPTGKPAGKRPSGDWLERQH